MRTRVLAAIGGAALLALAGPLLGIEVTATDDPQAIQDALVREDSGIDLTSVSITIQSHTANGAASIGTYTNAAQTYGIIPGVIISSGNVLDYGTGPNSSGGKTTDFGVGASAAQEALLDTITGGALDHFDATQIDISFDMLPGFDQVFFSVVWGTEEYEEFIGTSFIDAFGMFVNGVNVAFVDGEPINVDHPSMVEVVGTELDGLLGSGLGPGAVIHTFSAAVNPTGNLVTFIIADSGDDILDSTAYITALGGTAPDPVIPEPASGALLLALAAAGLLIRRRA